MKRVSLVPPDRHKGNGQPKIDGKFYTRASSLAKFLEDQGGLITWQAKMAMMGVARSDELRALAATTDESSREWYDLVKRASELGGATSGRDIGTVIHTATEAIDLGEDASNVPDDIRRDAEAYRDACRDAGLEPIAGEIFVVNDEFGTAGSFDRLVMCPDGRTRILDVKTVKSTKTAADAAKWTGLAWSVQTAVYQSAVPFCAERGRLTWDDIGVPGPADDAAIVVVVPRGTGTASLVDVDLSLGRQLAGLACHVRDARKLKPATARESDDE